MVIDTTINLGNVATALIALVGFVIAFTKMGGRLDLLTLRIKAVEEALKSQSDVVTRVAIIETRQAAQDQLIATQGKEMSDLRRGRGFVQDRSAGGIDGEY